MLKKALQCSAMLYNEPHTKQNTNEESIMEKFTTKQLQDALVALYSRNDNDARNAFAMTFDEVHSRMGDDDFDAWCESAGIL